MTATAQPAGDDPLDHALALVEHGLRPVPIKPGFKYPPMKSWQHVTADAKNVRNWWNGLYRGHGVGLVMGPQTDGVNLMALDIDTHDPNADGWDALAELEAEHGALPDTWRSLTGSGGAHILFSVPAGVVVRNQQASGNRIAPGIDVRGDGGQIVVAPTIHPGTGQPYAWEFAPWDVPLAECPAWLLELVRERPTPPPLDIPPPNTSPTNTNPVTQSPADLLRDRWDWRHELAQAGWTLAKDGQDSLWTRPGKNPRDGHSAVLHGDQVLVVFTTDIPDGWRTSGVITRDGSGYSLSPFAFYAATRHGGDQRAAGQALRAPTTPTGAAPAPQSAIGAQDGPYDPVAAVDDELRALLVDWTTFWATDHNEADWIAEPVIAAKRSHAIFAPGGTGKSLLSLYIAAALATGRDPFHNTPVAPLDVLYLDYEMTADDLAERLEQMGYGAATDLSAFHYALLPSIPPLDVRAGGEAVARLAEMVGARLVVIDTFGRAVQGEENDSDTVRAYYNWTGIELKKRDIAVVRVDHAGKDTTKGQRGSSGKNDDVDVVWQMARKDGNTYTLTAKKRRMGWIPETVNIELHEAGDLSFQLVDDDTLPTGTKDCAAALDELGVPADASNRKAGQALRDAGQGRQGQVVTAAQRYRRKRSVSFHFAGDNPGDNPVDNIGKRGGKRASDGDTEAPPEALDARNAFAQVDELGSAAGSTGKHYPTQVGSAPPPSMGRRFPASGDQRPVEPLPALDDDPKF